MIELKNFTKKYKDLVVLQDTNVKIGNNKISFLLGPNGCGKTTLLKCIGGLEDYSGTITYNNDDIDNIRKDALIIWDDCPFYDNLSGLNNLIILSEDTNLTKNDIKNIAKNYIDERLLKRKVKTYSYGQRKKLAIVLQEILNPKILIMDEISNGLDYDIMKVLKEDIKRISKDKNIILTGHQFGFYEDMVQEVLVFVDNTIKDVTEEYNECKSLGKIYERYYYGNKEY